MKIRADFVTNSSSSSYVAVTIQGAGDLHLHCFLDEYEVRGDPNLLKAKTARQIGEALCGVLDGGIEEEDMPEELEELIAQLEELPSLEEVSSITVETTDINRGEFIEAHLDDFDNVHDLNDMDYVEITSRYETKRKLRAAWFQQTKEIILTDEAQEKFDLKNEEGLYVSSNDSPREITVPAEARFLGQEDFDGCDNLETVIFEGEAEQIAANTFEYLPNLSTIIAPKMPLDKFQNEGKLAAVLGFAQQAVQGEKAEPYRYREEYLAYIETHRDMLMPAILRQLALLQTMLTERVISTQELPDWLNLDWQGDRQTLGRKGREE